MKDRAKSDSAKSDNAKSPTGTQAIDRALAVLTSFVAHPEQGISEVAERADLSPSTVHRIMRALVAAGYVTQIPENDRYRFGPSAVVLGRSARESLGFDVAKPLLEQLGGETGESVNMGVLDGIEVVVVQRVESVQPLRFDQPTGSRIKPHCSSMGKSLMAFGANEIVAELDLAKVTANTITSRAALMRELTEVRELGFALDREESIPGVSCVGAPVLDADGRAVAAIAVQGPTVRMTDERLRHLGRRLVRASAEISQAMHLTEGVADGR